MAEWTGFVRRWEKAPENRQSLDNLMSNLTDNREVNQGLRKRTNAIFDALTCHFPALDRVTRDDKVFDQWRLAVPEKGSLEKLFEKEDQQVDAKGEINWEGLLD